MELKDLGFDDWFRERQDALDRPDCRAARVTAVDRDRYLVRNEHGEIPAELTGRLLFSAESPLDLPAVGDWALVQLHNDDTLAIIHDVLPRKSVLKRKTPGKKVDVQVIAANVDTAFLVQACDSDFNPRRLERYLVVAREGGVAPLVLLSKSDLVGEEELAQRTTTLEQAGVGCEVIPFSSATGTGLDRIRERLEPGKTYALLGSSGVGKTTLLNHLLGREAFETRAVREKDGKGRHTTTRRHLIVLDRGALLVDNPGMRELGMMDVGAGLEESFADVSELAEQCRFRDCTHTQEVGCAVLDAVERGDVSEARYESYMKLLREAAYHDRSYVEHRKRDKEFGKMYKSIMKHNRKK